MAAPVPSNATFLATSYGRAYLGCTADQVTSALADAAAQTNARIYTTEQCVIAVCLKAATILFDEPGAYPMRESDPKASSRWEKRLRHLQRSASMGIRVVGQRGDETL